MVATLGSSLSLEQKELLGRTFDTIVIFTDWDTAGRKLGHNIEEAFPHKDIKWAGIDGVYPRMVKDAADLTDEEVRQSLRDAISRFEYSNMVDEEKLIQQLIESGTINE